MGSTDRGAAAHDTHHRRHRLPRDQHRDPGRAVIEEQFPWALEQADAIAGLLRHYRDRKRERGLLDLDDLLIAWRRWSLIPMSERGCGRAGTGCSSTSTRMSTSFRSTSCGAQSRRPRAHGRRRRRTGDLRVPGGERRAPARARRCVPRRHARALEHNFRSTNRSSISQPGAPGRTEVAARRRPSAAGAPRPTLVSCRNADDEARTIADRILAAHVDGTPWVRRPC